MFEGVREKRSKWFDYDISDEQSCLRAIRNGGIAALFSAALTAVIAIIAMNTTSEDPTVAYLLDPAIMVDAVLLAILGLFVFRKSRVAATVLLVYFTLSKIMMWFDLGAPKGLLVSALFFMIYLTAVRATFSWHANYREASGGPVSAGRPAKPTFGLIIGFYTIFFTLLSIVSAISLPDDWMIWRAGGGVLAFVDVATAATSLLAGVAIVGLILVRHRVAPTAARLYFAGRGLLAGLTVMSIALLTDFPADSSQTGLVWFNLAMIVFCGAGFLYWNRSKRVGNLFLPSQPEHALRPATASASGPLPPSLHEAAPEPRLPSLSQHGGGCPKCNHENQSDAEECARCGVILAKARGSIRGQYGPSRAPDDVLHDPV